ncbi:hypothetical protein [Enterococcus timonensis]|uniref:hypothetical protein n=1 Tax=Enterococcus timonensis TaxID=1852364 RepID=UPI0008D9BE0B|nr:hypothetical protein [Enterococcus timonensis]
MDLAFHLVSNLNIFNLAFVSMTETLKDIKEEQVSKHQERVLCDSLQRSMERNTQKLISKVETVGKACDVQTDPLDKEMTTLLLKKLHPYIKNVKLIQKIMNQPIDSQTYQKCLPIFELMNQQMSEMIETIQKDLKITTKAIFK